MGDWNHLHHFSNNCPNWKHLQENYLGSNFEVGCTQRLNIEYTV